MRKALTLIELILSVVIISIVFTVIPKIIIATNQSFVSATKQDGIFNAVQLMHMISNTPFDLGSYETYNILNTTDGNPSLDCNESIGYRVGGFIGGRNCLGTSYDVELESDFTQDPILSISGYNSYDENATASKCTNYDTYGLNPEVEYKEFSTNVSGDSATIDLTGFIDSTSSNVKYVRMRVGFGAAGQSGCVDFDYYSANLGQLNIARRDY